MFVGRQKELSKITKRIQGEYKEFIAITGKRGVVRLFLLEKVKKLVSPDIKILEIVGPKAFLKESKLSKLLQILKQF